jgi:hypothetical protein
MRRTLAALEMTHDIPVGSTRALQDIGDLV